jgi:hypothetical protein
LGLGELLAFILTQELKAAVAAVAEPQKKKLLAVLNKLDLYQKKNR